MYIHSNNEIDKRINVSKIANNISTMGDNSTAAGYNSRLITVLVQHAQPNSPGTREEFISRSMSPECTQRPPDEQQYDTGKGRPTGPVLEMAIFATYKR